MATLETVAYGGWANNLRLANEHVELIITLDVGPRVISFKPQGGENVFKNYADQIGGTGEAGWQIRGGHRLWLAPEVMPFTYHLDNDAVAHEVVGDGAVRLTPLPETVNGFQKQLDIALHPDGRVTATHRATNIGDKPQSIAVWALSVMAPGGIEVIPQPGMGAHPGLAGGDFSPNRTIILWPFTDLTDNRWHIGRDFITLRQDAARGATKLGLAHSAGWVGYWLNGTLFVKRFAYDKNLVYTDNGANFETFTNEDMLEVESLGPLVTLAPGASAEHVEEWRLFTGVPAFRADNESEIAAALAGLMLL